MPRIDKWLWCVRIFKTRSLATDFCKKGKVKINDVEVKPAREVKENEIIEVSREGIKYTYKVLGLLDKRVSAKLAVEYKQDITSAEELEKLEIKQHMRSQYRSFGTGRPSKKDRRDINKFTNS